MAEAKNTFLRSKMNQDLDDRLVPSGEYREGLNIAVSRSEGDDVGALEDILGNNLITSLLPTFTITISNLSGNTFDYISDVGVANGDHRISVRYEVYSATSENPIASVIDVSGYGGGLVISTPTTAIANGDVLTIKPNMVVIGAETNVNTNKVYLFATNYTDSSFDSLSRYASISNPNGGQCAIFEYNLSTPSINPKVLVEGPWLNLSTTHNILNANILEDLLFWTDDRNQPRKINISNAVNATFTSTLDYANGAWGYYKNEDHVSVAKYAPITPIQLWEKYDDALHPSGPSYETTMRDVVSEKLPDGTTDNPYYDSEYGGDPDFLEDKFVKFSYRFKFDDNEYSIMAPFTQAAFIPKQDGFFLEGDEKEAFSSTLVKFMENKVNNIQLRIPMPFPLEASPVLSDEDNFMQCADLSKLMHVSELEILYKESDALAVQVLERISVAEIIQQGSAKFFNYDYQARKPFRTLPEKDLVRVYDKIPPRAKAQEVISNRLVYGNFINKLTPPATLDYNVALSDKYALSDVNVDKGYTSVVEYPQHTVKHNRNYEVGVVLADRYGRSSSPILSEVTDSIISQGINFGGSTFYAPYRFEEVAGQSLNESNIIDWPGDSIKVLFNSPIVSNRNNLLENNVGTGTPGIFSYDEYTSSAMNPLGWYTYKIVVKQQEQEYYNLYLPGIINSYPAGPIKTQPGANQVSLLTPGSSYTNPGNILDTVGGTGSGLKVNIIADNTSGVVISVTIAQPGTGYAFGDTITIIQTGSGNDAEFIYTLYDLSYSNFVPGNSIGGLPIEPAIEGDTTAFTTLFSDNINKLPRDLEEVGPEQKQYRSSIALYGRVTNDDFSTAPYNSQFFPARQSHSADQIAEALNVAKIPNEKNLNPPTGLDNNPSRLSLSIYQNETNPYLVRLSTDKAIGQRDHRSIPNANVQYGDQAFPVLAVYETEPTISNLDIYWETSTWGWIGRLNHLIETSTEAPIDITLEDNEFEFFENQDPGGAGTGTGDADSPFLTPKFQPILQNGLASGNGVISNFIVTDQTNSDRTSEFEIVGVDGVIGDPGYGFRLKIVDPFLYDSNASTESVFNFNFDIAQNSFPDDKLAVYFQGQLENVAPDITNCAGAQSGALNKIPGDTDLYTFTAVNGSFDITKNTEQLIFSFDDGTNVYTVANSTTQFSIDASTGHLTLTGGSPTGSFPMIIKVTDAAGAVGALTDTCSILVNYGLVEVPVAFQSCGDYLAETVDGDNMILQWDSNADVLRFQITNPGSNYVTGTNIPTQYAPGSSGNGTGLTVDIIDVDPPISGGGILEVVVNNPGSGYDIGELVRPIPVNMPTPDAELRVIFSENVQRCGPTSTNFSADIVQTEFNTTNDCGGGLGLVDLPPNSRLMISAFAECGAGGPCENGPNNPYSGTMSCYMNGNFHVEYKNSQTNGAWTYMSDIKGTGSDLGTATYSGGGMNNPFRGLYATTTGWQWTIPGLYFPSSAYNMSGGSPSTQAGFGRYRIFENDTTEPMSIRVVQDFLTGDGPCYGNPNSCTPIDPVGDQAFVTISSDDGYYDIPACTDCDGTITAVPATSFEYIIKDGGSGFQCPSLPYNAGFPDPYGLSGVGSGFGDNPGDTKRVWAQAFKHLYVERFYENKELTIPLVYGEYKTGFSLTANSNILLKQTGRAFRGGVVEINLPPGAQTARVYDGGILGNGTYKAKLNTNGFVGGVFAGSNGTHGSLIRDSYATSGMLNP